MQPFTIGSKTVSIFPSIEPEAPIIYLNTFSDEGQKVYGAAQPDGCPPFTLVSISDLDWNHDMAPWDSPAALKRGSPSPAGQTTTCGCWWRRSYPGQRKSSLGLRHGVGSPGTLWQGCSPCTPSTRQMCSHG